MSNTLAYLLDGKIYINLTNRCTNSCIFCLRNDKDDVCGKNMWLDSENFTARDVIEQIEEIMSLRGSETTVAIATSSQVNDNAITTSGCRPPRNDVEITFCGYGEPLLKLDILKEVAGYIKEKHPDIKLRINTNGHANFVYKRNVCEELKGLIDTISVSLNGATEEEYNELSKPSFKGAYDEVKKFIKASSDAGINTVATIVEGYKGRHLDIEACKTIAKDLGATLRVREWIENGYE